ncbi:MAG: hypothetical protein Q8876_09970, partial [Bacillota bacterium]|nr:hypothetical protein [Bacillota bacterium]
TLMSQPSLPQGTRRAETSIRFCILQSMSVKQQIAESDGIYFITITAYNWLHLYDVTDGNRLVYKWFDLLKENMHYITGYLILHTPSPLRETRLGQGIQLKITILLLWLIEAEVFQMPKLHKHFNVVCRLKFQKD